MILRPLSKDKVIIEYIIYAYTLLYANSVNENCEYGDFYKLCEISPKTQNGVTDIPYEDYYCSEEKYRKILDNVCSIPYILVNGKRKRRLTSYEATRVNSNVALGCSPCSSKKGFIERHPKFKKYAHLAD